MLKLSPTITIAFLISGLLYAQPAMPQLIYSDIIVVPSDTLYNIFYTYKIPLDHLVFEKGADLFLAQYRISLEVFDAKKDKFITRAIKEKNIQVPDYDQTLSNSIFSEGSLELKLIPGNYSVTEIFYDYKSAKEYKFPQKILNIDTPNKFLSPLIVDNQTFSCNDRESNVLADYGGQLPFDENEYTFILPVKNFDLDSLSVEIIQEGDTVFNRILKNPARGLFAIAECGGKIILDDKSASAGYSLFKLDGASTKIKEGNFAIKVFENSSDSKTFRFTCKWINKPSSLKDPEKAIEDLKFVEKDSIIHALLDADKDDYQKELAEYWKKIDPTPLTEFNPLMQEYYLRLDYAAKTFGTVEGINGANTDRGKIYIRFGKPAEVVRASDEHGYIVETWTYTNTQRKFVFVDKKGTGDFSLISG
ncbi:MAG TPA: GWxTD domain-containing protein [Ignavibacteriaceae bacterium]|nr:GWxTD domain-containing protein [Ignavibacteriaceae bacterium]